MEGPPISARVQARTPLQGVRPLRSPRFAGAESGVVAEVSSTAREGTGLQTDVLTVEEAALQAHSDKIGFLPTTRQCGAPRRGANSVRP